MGKNHFFRGRFLKRTVSALIGVSMALSLNPSALRVFADAESDTLKAYKEKLINSSDEKLGRFWVGDFTDDGISDLF